MTVEITKATITQFLQGPKAGRFTTRDGQVLTFNLSLVQDESLCRELESGWLPEMEIPVTVGLYRSPSGLVVTHITRSIETGQKNLPADPGPYRDAKEAYLKGLHKKAEEFFLEAIRKDDRQVSAVKDLASLLNERGRTQEAVMLLNQFLMTKTVDKEEQAKLRKLRQNIHDAMPHNAAPAAPSATFREKIVWALAHSAPTAPKPVPSFAPVPVETSLEFVCLIQNKNCFRLAPWRANSSLLEISWPTHPQFKLEEPVRILLATFSVGPDQKPLSEGVGVEPKSLPGAWLLPLSLGEWQNELQISIPLEVGDCVYFRDDDIVAGPWKVGPNGGLKASNSNYVLEWTWDESWRRLEFRDRIFLLDLPDERNGNFYDFAGPEELSEWLESKLVSLGPEVAAQFEKLTVFCQTHLSDPLELSRWERIHSVLNRIPLRTQTVSLETGVPDTSASRPPLSTSISPNSAAVQRLHFATSACRCLLVPNPQCSQDYAEALKGSEYFLVTPSINWLGLRDAWTELEWLWNSAHSRPERQFLVHFEQANLSLMHHWAKPLLNVAHGLSPCLLGFSELGWPENLRLHWSLSAGPEAFPVAQSLRPAYAALALAEDFFDVDWQAIDETWCTSPQHHRPETGDGWAGDYARSAALETAQLAHLFAENSLGSELAIQIRREFPLQYWSRFRGD